MAFHPVRASEEITEKYIRYLKTIFSIDDEDYQRQFEKLLNDRRQFSNGPYLDVTDSFVKGKSVNDLILEGIVPKSFDKVSFPLDRTLYLHQETAIRQISRSRRISPAAAVIKSVLFQNAFSLSSNIVTGPSFTSDTFISVRKRPVST